MGNYIAQTRTITNTQVTSYTYDVANRMTKVGTVNYTWDNNGNLTNDGSANYLYDRANRLISTTLGGVTTQFSYNGDGVRLKQIIAGVPTTYTQDLAAPLPVVLQAKTGGTTTKYLYALGTRPLAQNGGAWEYLLPDALGSVRQIADANGNVTLAESYEPYGSVLNSTGSASSIFAYAGEEADTTGLIYLRARYLQPRLGIFLARDLWEGDVMRPGSTNGWNYASGNPIASIDPTGMCTYRSGDPEGTCRVDPSDNNLFRIALAHPEAIPDTRNWPEIEAWNPELFNARDNKYYIHRNDLVYLRPRDKNQPVQGESPSDTISGYLEGELNSTTLLCITWWVQGEEIVYDFAKIPPERARFTFVGVGVSPEVADVTVTDYAGYIWGFDPNSRDIFQDYEGPFLSGSVGATVSPAGILNFGGGVGGFTSLTNQVFGYIAYASAGIGASGPGLGATFSILGTWYTGDYSSLHPFGTWEQPAAGMYSALSTGDASPVQSNLIIAATRSAAADRVYLVLGRYYASKGLTPVR